MSASKRPREDDDDLWGDELDANTVDECFFLASQAMSQNAPTEAHTTKEDAQPTSSLFCKPADTKFKVPQPISHFKPKQRLSDSSSSPSSAFTKKFPSTAPSQLFPKKVSASASQSHTFPQQRQYTPTQLDVHKKSSPNVFPKMVSASKSVTKFPSTSGVLSTSKSSATVRSVTPSWPQPNSAGSSKLPGSSSTDRQPRTSWSASASAGSSCSTETNHVRSMGALSSIGGKMTIPTKPEGNVSLSTPVPEEIDFRMTSTRGTVHMLNTNSFPTAGSSKVPEDNVDTYNELQQLRMAKKKLEEELQTRDGEVAILRTQLNSVKCDLEKQRTLKQQEVEKQASEFKEKMKIMQKELEQKSTLLEFKNLEAVTATERCRLLESNSKVKLVEPQPTQTMETFPENPIPSTSVKEKEEVVNTENKGEKTIGEENTKQKHREKIEFIKSTFGELDHKTKPPPQGWILSSLVKPYIFEKPRNDVVRKPERYNERAPGFNLTPYGVTVYAIHPVLSQLLRQEDLDDFESRALIDQMIWKCYLLLQVQMTYLKKNMVHIDKSIADCLDANLFQETGKVYRNEKVHIMSARKWFKDEQSIEIRRIFGLMAALASVSDYAATYMTGNIREKLWVNTMCMKHLRFSHELIRARNQYISALNKLGPKPEPTKNETKMTEKEELQRKKMLEHVEDLRMTAQFENSLKDLKQLRKAWIFLLEHFQQFEDIINGKPVELDPETEDKLSKEMDYWIDYFKRRGRLGALIKRHKRNIRKAKIAKKLPKPKKVVKRKRKSKPKNQLFVQKCKKSIKRWTATKYPKPPTEQELDDELQVLDLEREDWINVDPYMESDEPFSPAAYLRNYVIKCRKMGRFANLNAFDSLKPKPSTSQPAKKRSRRLKIELDTDSDDADSNQTAISSEQGTSIFKKPRPPLAPSPHKKVKKPCDSDDPHNNESARSSEQGTCTFKKPPRPALAPSPHKKVKKPHESDDADNNQRAISSEQVTSTFKKPPPRPPLAPSPHKKKVKDGYLHYIHPMKWNLISIDEVRKAMNNGGQFDMKKATYTPLLKDSIDNSIESLLPSPLQKIKLRMELKENPISKGRQILKHPLWIPQFVPDLVIQKIENLTPEELEYYKKPGEPHWQGPKVDFFQFLCDMIQIIADQRWTVTCNGILFGVTHLVKVIVSHTEIKEERCEVLTKLIKELLLCRPSINVLTELLVLLYRLGHVKTIQENLCIGAGPDPYLQGRFGLVHFHKGLPRMDMCHKQEDVYYFYRTKSCMISLITFMVTLRRIDDIEWYYRTGMAMLMWMSTSSSVSPNGVHWIGPFIDKEMRDCQCRARIIEALIITMHTIYEYVAKYDFKPRHKEDKLFPDLKDFLGTAVRFIKKQAYLDNDTGLLMTNREGQYQEVVRGLWENVDEIDFGIDERKALKILNDLEDQVDGNPPELEMTDEGEEIMGTITNKIMSFLKKKSIENTREIMSKKRHSLKMTPKVHR